jgi:hypothetical protein
LFKKLIKPINWQYNFIAKQQFHIFNGLTGIIYRVARWYIFYQKSQIWTVLKWKIWYMYITAIWYFCNYLIYVPTYDRLVYFWSFSMFFHRFGIFYQGKSGNPDHFRASLAK